uniref:Fe2OG dioxygenase domain-containing protein n=1 Tax=Vitis vinifera TaxID=29760 RepID=A5BUA7_VITVI|nr:hypothetical protein VITISV_039948 [Vitis vinifera]
MSTWILLTCFVQHRRSDRLTENSRRVPRNDLNIRHWHFITRPGLPRDQRQNNSTVAANEEQSERQVEIRHQARVAGGLPFLFILLPRRIIRLCSGVFISASEDKTGTLDLIEQKIARVIMIPRTHGEIKPKENCLNWLGQVPPFEFVVMKRFLTDVVYHVAFNILRYEIGQRYNSHYDAFDPAEYGPQKSHRIATFLVYLSDVEEGGETMFPFENGLNMDKDYDFQRCIGLKVKPHQGDGLLFYSMFPNGTIDPTSLHGSCPVIKGEKWVATKWIRDQEQDD